MKRQLITLLMTSLLGLILLPAVFGQANSKLLYAGADLLRGVGKYNGLGYGGGINARIQFPLPVLPELTLTAKVGVEYYKINYYTYLPGYSYLGYGYNAITGFGFNTVYAGAGYVYPYETWGLNIPVVVGPRLYLPKLINGLDGIHTDLNVGADIAATRTLLTSLHVSPGVGFTPPLKNGRFLDVTVYYATSFARGSGVVGVGVSYGLPIKL